MVRAFTQNAVVKYEPEKDGKFSLFDGNIEGTFIELVSMRLYKELGKKMNGLLI